MNSSYRMSMNMPRRKSTCVFDTDQLLNHDSVLFNPIDSDFEIDSGDIIATAPLHTVSNVLSSLDGKRKTIFSYYNVPEAAIPRVSREWDHLITITNPRTTPNNLHHYRCYMDQVSGMANLTLHIVTEQVSATLSYLHENSLLTFVDKVKMLSDVAQTLSYLKQKDFAHRYLNLDSIMAQSDDHGRKTFKLSNWGAWSELTIEDPEVKAHYAIFSAPELKKLKPKTIKTEMHSKADVYSLGMVFMQLMGFTTEELQSFEAYKVKSRHTFMNYQPRDALCKLILEGVSPEPEQRPSMHEFYERVETILQHKNDLEDIDPVRFREYLRGEPYIKPMFSGEHIHEASNPNSLIEKYSLNPRNLESQTITQNEKSFAVFESKRNQRLVKAASMILGVYPLVIISLTVFIIIQKYEKHWIDSDSFVGGLRGVYQGVGHVPIEDVYFTKGNCSDGYQQENLGEYSTGYDFELWKGSKVCVKRYTYVAFHNSSRQGGNGTVKCSTGVWISEFRSCPITEVQFSTQPNQTNQERKENKSPVNSLRLSVSNTSPCLSTNEKTLVFDQALSSFVSVDCQNYGKYPNASNFDNEPSVQVFEEQSWGKSFTKQKAFSSSLQNYNAYLYALPRLELKDGDNCTSYSTTNILGCIQDHTDSWKIAFPGLIISLVLIMLVGLLLLRNFQQFKSSAKELHEVNKFTYFYFGLASLPILMSTFFVMKESSTLRKCYNSMQPLQECLTNPNASKPLENVSVRAEHLSELSDSLLILIGIAVILIFLSLITFFAIWLPEFEFKGSDTDIEKEKMKKNLLEADRYSEDMYQSKSKQINLQI